MTKGSPQGNGKQFRGSQNNWPVVRRKTPQSWSDYARCGLGLALLAALHPNPVHAADEVWPETSSIDQSIQSASQLPAGVELLPAEAYNAGVPLPPGEAPSNEIDAFASGENSDLDDFWKPKIHAGVTTSVVFDDNIFITNTAPESDVIFVTSARVTLAYGNVQSWAARFIETTARALAEDTDEGSDNLIALTYSPTAEFFTDNDSLNTTNHDAAATIRWSFTKLRLALDGRFQTLTDPDPDLGRRSDRQLISSHLQINYPWTEKTEIEGNLDFQNRDYKRDQDSTQIEANLFAVYRGMPKITWGVGLAVGQLELDGGDTQNYQQLLLRFGYNTYSKLNFSASFGGELRQIDGGDDQLNGVYAIGATYDATETTRFLLSLNQQTDPSASQDAQSIERTTISLGWDQSLFQAVSLSSNLSYSLSNYSSGNGNNSREDQILSLSITATVEITKYAFFRLGYIYTNDDSNFLVNSYESNRANLSLTVLF